MGATSVAPLVGSTSLCWAHCTSRPTWQVGPHAKSCDTHLALVLRGILAVSDGFAPQLVLPIGGVA